ncbi:MAG: cell wall-binding repeat-containing protein, partial [Chloroflexota bacterium]|nr:cell wall-binding repeat-containing protein [Chloroflexota bacterium]
SVFIATGTKFPDGLAGGPVAALLPGPLLLVAPTQLPSVVKSELQRLGPDNVYVLGGTGVVSGTVVRAIDAALP